MNGVKLVSVAVNEDTIEIIYRKDYSYIIATNPPKAPNPDIWKEVYGVKDCRLTKLDTVEATYKPPQSEYYYFER